MLSRIWDWCWPMMGLLFDEGIRLTDSGQGHNRNPGKSTRITDFPRFLTVATCSRQARLQTRLQIFNSSGYRVIHCELSSFQKISRRQIEGLICANDKQPSIISPC
jgi:hypothetical protein